MVKYRVAKGIGCRIFQGHFLQKSPMLGGSVAERPLYLKALLLKEPGNLKYDMLISKEKRQFIKLSIVHKNTTVPYL